MTNVNWATDKQFKNIWQDKKGIIIGRGLNAEYVRDERLDAFDGIKIGCNSAYKTTRVDALVWMDPHFFESNWKEILPLDCFKFAIEPVHYDHHGIEIFGLKAKQPERCSNLIEDGFYPCDLSGYIALNLALIFGLNPIYLYGFSPNTEELKNRSDNFNLISKWVYENNKSIYVTDEHSYLRKFFEYKPLPLISIQ